ncbi:hypothetical protein [Methanococcus maripaludis]|uniref:Putative acetyltransferase n=1 Tax=Methanococcus maripaludis TaxID=39152 RepID=A0A2L1CAB2_METMI|nr:hypothetical protein [Methanococcus maripaludis]AVB76318.1 hypothetical protein MMJJ_09090 [Methanococcus maripaludis]MBA2864873.1 putative acetyltransferase [Methanococcus maripaludis]MBB6497588.1 putative acetyltransferase [Methanococcus maripaludis]
MEFKNNSYFVDNVSENISILSLLKEYEERLLGFEKDSFKVKEPYVYVKFCLYTTLLFRILEKEISKINLSEDEEKTVNILKKYKYRDFEAPYEENYIKFTVWKNESGTLVYQLCDLRENESSSENWNKIYSVYMIHPKYFKHIKKIVLKLINEN